MADDPNRRGFLKVATCSLIGGGVGLAVGIPTVKLLLDPAGRQIVTTPTEPIDLGAARQFAVGAPPQRVDIIAPVVKDAWTASTNVVLGAAWVRRTAPDKVEAFSAVCPHLGCAIGWEGNGYLCPCHDSRFSATGEKQTGPSERGLDPLPVKLEGDRLRLTWIRYKLGQTAREPA